jgi:hypothetical protein
LRILGLNAAKEKLEIVSGAAPPPFRIFAGGFFLKNAFGLIQEYCTEQSEVLESECAAPHSREGFESRSERR